MSPCPHAHVSLPIQVICELFRRTFIQRYDIDTFVNLAL
jgi:hypothetical protein